MTDQPTGWVDSHCHLPMLTGDAADPAADAVTRARDAGVVGMICVGTNLETSRGAIADAARFPDVRATVGLHPHDASALEDVWDDLVALAASDTVVGIGETGFDLHYNHSAERGAGGRLPRAHRNSRTGSVSRS